MKIRTILFSALALALFGAGAARATQLAPGIPAPDWQLLNLDGHPVQLSEFKGKVVVLDFWATWYPASKSEISNLAALQEQDKSKGLVVIGVSVDDGPEAVLAFLKSHLSIDYPIVMGNDEMRSSYGGITTVPTTFIIDRKGVITRIHQGPFEKTTFKKDLGKLL
jgi:peroxiredoxin